MESQFATSKEAKAAGWFSRRHQTSSAHYAARTAWEIRAAKRPKQTWSAKTGLWRKEATDASH